MRSPWRWNHGYAFSVHLHSGQTYAPTFPRRAVDGNHPEFPFCPQQMAAIVSHNLCSRQCEARFTWIALRHETSNQHCRNCAVCGPLLPHLPPYSKAVNRFPCETNRHLSFPSVPGAEQSDPASPRTAAATDVLPPAIASSNAHVWPAALRSLPVVLLAGERPVLNPSRQTQTSPQIPQVVGQQAQCQPHLVRAEPMPREPRHLHRALAFFDPLLRRTRRPLEEGWKLLVISLHARGRDIESRNCWVGMVARFSHYPLITPS